MKPELLPLPATLALVLLVSALLVFRMADDNPTVRALEPTPAAADDFGDSDYPPLGAPLCTPTPEEADDGFGVSPWKDECF